MTTHELILRWAELLLQVQVLAFVIVCFAVLLWRHQIGQLIEAIARRGGKLKAGPVSAEIVAGAEEGASPIQQESQEPIESLSPEEQAMILKRLALRFDQVKLKGPAKRSKFVDELRSLYQTGWSWEYLRESLNLRRISMRFCAAAVLPSINMDIDPVVVANSITCDSSSLVRYRLVEALLYWATSSVAIDDARSAVRSIVSEYIDENRFVDQKVQILLKILGEKA